MAKETTVRARIDETLKEDAETILKELGITTARGMQLKVLPKRQFFRIWP